VTVTANRQGEDLRHPAMEPARPRRRPRARWWPGRYRRGRPGVPAGTRDAARYNHYALLRSIERLFGLTPLRHAADPTTRPSSPLTDADPVGTRSRTTTTPAPSFALISTARLPGLPSSVTACGPTWPSGSSVVRSAIALGRRRPWATRGLVNDGLVLAQATPEPSSHHIRGCCSAPSRRWTSGP
jgi:hypothetical protein